MTGIVPVMGSGVVTLGLGTTHHVTVRIETQPEVGGPNALATDITGGVGQELGQVWSRQSPNTRGHVGTRASHSV